MFTELQRQSTKRKIRRTHEHKEACSISMNTTGSSHSRQRDSSRNFSGSSRLRLRRSAFSTRTPTSCCISLTKATAVDLKYLAETFVEFCLTPFLLARSAGGTKPQQCLPSAMEGTW